MNDDNDIHLGDLEWCYRNLRVTIWGGRRFLYDGNKRIAVQTHVKGDAEEWAVKKIIERENSTYIWLEKLESQIQEVRAIHEEWLRRLNEIDRGWDREQDKKEP